VPLPVRRHPACRAGMRPLLLALVACWMLVLAAPVAAQAPGVAQPSIGEAPAMTASSGSQTLGAAVTGQADDGGDPADRELVLGLVAIVLLAVAIGLHARYRDRD
jgi:hypothetical protein